MYVPLHYIDFHCEFPIDDIFRVCNMLSTRFGKSAHFSIISNSVIHLRSYTNSAIAGNSAPISQLTPRDRQRRCAERQHRRIESRYRRIEWPPLDRCAKRRRLRIECRCRRIEWRVFHVSQCFNSVSLCFTSGSWCFTSGSLCIIMFYMCFMMFYYV